ncbi:hypothetical protein [Pseudoalteromonas rubra]|uniref:hypothetical protein n=1 Tax=Pseudoalteromonas rubra TaxID=43658 RepID=UPI001486177E|nr:hypothetical protein [Pseudoalteromonas rubra]
MDEFYQKEAQRAKLLSDAGYSDAEIEAFYKSEGAQRYFNKEMAKLTAVGVDLAKLGGATAALIANSDVNLAAMTAENAAQHNCLFLIPLGLMVLKGIDIALTANELYEIYDTMGKNPEQGQEMLEEWLIEQAAGGIIGKAIPGFKTFEEMLDYLKRNDVLSAKMLKDIEDNIASGKQGTPSSDINVVNVVDNRLNLGDVTGEFDFITKVKASHVGKYNDGFYGEQVAKQILEESTGLPFKDIIRNGSNNGPDLPAIDRGNKTIWVVEVKSSIRGDFPDPDDLDLYNRTEKWMRDAAKGKIANKDVSPEAKEYAKEIVDLMDNHGFSLTPMFAKVNVPRPVTKDNAPDPSQIGVATVTLVPVGKP